MTQRDRWQALQSHLGAARRFVEADDLQRALVEVNAALALDPDFLAAHSLRDRILKKSKPALPVVMPPPAAVPVAVPLSPASMTSAAVAPAAPPLPAAAALTSTPPAIAGAAINASIDVMRPDAFPTSPVPHVTPRVDYPPPATAKTQPLVSVEGYTRFEARARRRRVDRRIEAARAAMERRKLHEAASALDEIIALDPNLPELAGLTAEFDELRKGITTPHRGPWLMAAAVFVVVVLGASWLHESSLLVSFPVKANVALVAPPTQSLTFEPLAEKPTAIATAGVSDVQNAIDEPEAPPIVRPRRDSSPAVAAVLRSPAAPDRDRPAAPLPPLPAPAVAISVSNDSPTVGATVTPTPPPAPPPQPAAPPRATTSAASPASAVAVSPPAPISVAPPIPDDENLVKSVLQRYRRAYEGLDARSAHAVWPAVNQAALARAFDGLASQAITFDECDVQVRGAAASATCRGTARYVPKIGSREPRVESRVWSFALKKDGAEWKIDSARAER